MTVRAFEVSDEAGYAEKCAPGAFYFLHRDGEDGPCGIVHACPCGCCVRLSTLYFKGRGVGKPEWTVEGTWPGVTLSPSIGMYADDSVGFHWHGWLRAGEFVTA